jgi:rhodanese-related sulfurtransferase
MSFAARHLGLLSTTSAGNVSPFAPQPWTGRQSMRLFSAPADITHVGKAKMEQIIEEYEAGDSDFVVIDVRTSEEIINTGKLSPNTFTLPVQVIMQKNVFALDDQDFEEVTGFEKPSPDTTLVFSCAAGIRSVYACQFAGQAGYSKLINYTGGANEWFQPTRF